MVKLTYFLNTILFSSRGLTRGYYVNKLNWSTRYFVKLLSSFLLKFIYGFLLKPGKVFILLNHLTLTTVTIFLKENSLIKLESLTDIFGADHPQSFDGRFTLTYSFLSYKTNTRFFLRTFVNTFQPVFSLVNFYPSANWLEREVWDLYGVKFYFHPDLRRILTDYGFRGHPLRKDFPLVGFVELRYDDSFRSIVFEPVELTQDFRFFKFVNPWFK